MFECTHVDDLRFIGGRFKQARTHLGLTPYALAREAGYRNINKGLRRIMHLEHGEAPRTDETILRRFAHVLDLDMDELFEQLRERKMQRRAEEHRRQKTWLATLLGKAREHKGWSIEQVIVQAGLSPSKNYERRLEHLESGENRFPMQAELEALANALDIPLDDARAAYTRECEFYDRLNARPQVIVRAMAAVYLGQKYPEGLDTEQVLRFALEYSANHCHKVCVVLPDGRAVYCEPDGSRFESRRGPHMSIR